jgi:hypothetical protein
MSEDSEKRVVVFLKDGNTAESEYMDKEAAQAEFERILAERPGQNSVEVIRVGTRAAFRSGEFSRIEIQGHQVFAA